MTKRISKLVPRENPIRWTHEQVDYHTDDVDEFVMMPAIDFLALTVPYDGYPSVEDLQDEAEPLDFYNRLSEEGKISIAPFLRIRDGQVTGHEGRHRAAALMNAEGQDAKMLVAIVQRGKSSLVWRGEYSSVIIYARGYPRFTSEEVHEALRLKGR